MVQIAVYELNPTGKRLFPVQAPSKEIALGIFAREENLKLEFAEEGMGHYTLTNTSTGDGWQVVVSH